MSHFGGFSSYHFPQFLSANFDHFQAKFPAFVWAFALTSFPEDLIGVF